MIESLLIKNATLALETGLLEGDLLIKNGKIVTIAPKITEDAERVINAKGLIALPGLIDAHVHFRDPGVTEKEDLYTGSAAAAAGGITSFFEMPNTKPSTTTRALMAEKKKIASEKSIVNYNFFIGATSENLEELQKVENVAGIKIYVGSSTGSLLVDEQSALEEIFKNTKALIAVHSEDETMVRENQEKYKHSTDVKDFIQIRSAEAALKCTKRLEALSKKHKRRLHICHLTTKEELNYLMSCQNPYLTTEVCPQHLFLQWPDIYDQIDTFAQINPPIREKEHRLALFEGLKKGFIPMVATDHAPHLIEEKLKGFPNAPSGMPGVETMLPLMLEQVHQGQWSLMDVVRWLSTAPAQIFKVKNKGLLKEGYDGDVTLIDLNKKAVVEPKKFKSKAQWSAFSGWTLRGWPIVTVVNGQVVYQEGDIFESVKGKEVQINP